MSQNQNLLISIIVTIYNTEKYLESCINSLINQTYKNLQIILVDDGSTDNSGIICDRFSERDNRITVIHQTNGGSSAARKSGMEAALGDYVTFVDSDDWIDLATIEKCLNEAQPYNDIECILFSYSKEFKDRTVPMHIFPNSTYFSAQETEDAIYRRLFGLSEKELTNPERMDNITPCCMKLYKSTIVKNGKFFDNRIIGSAEDALFNMYALHNCKSALYIDECFYHYRKVSTSITNNYRPELEKKWKILFETMNSVITEKQLPHKYQKALTNRIALSITGIGINEICSSENFFKKFNKIRDYLHSNYYHTACVQIPTTYMPFIWKTFFFCCKHHITLLVYLMLYAMTYLRKH